MPNKNWASARRFRSSNNLQTTPETSSIQGLPRFVALDAEAWFLDAEREFIRTNTTHSFVRAKFVIQSLNREEIEFVRDIMAEIDENNDFSYQLVKRRLLMVFDNSREECARLLLNDPPFDIETGIPSSYMWNMRRLNVWRNTPDNLFMAIFIHKMPTTLRNAMYTASYNPVFPTDLGALADLMDVIWKDINSSARHY